MIKTKSCFKCGRDDRELIQHHISYSPEKVVDCCHSCHVKIHKRIRKNNACPISVKETRRISINSSIRRNRKNIQFSETLLPNVRLCERIDYWGNTGSITISSSFFASNKKSLWYADVC